MTNSFLGFQNLNDPQLINLEMQVLQWWERFLNKDRPCWLMICGKSGNGKTHCARHLWKEATRLNLIHSENADFLPHLIWWPKMVNDLRSGVGFPLLGDLGKWPLVVLDEIGADRDTTGFVTDRLYFALAQRDRRWTVITTNLSFTKIREMDERIASRAFRNDGVVVEVDTEDFYTRTK